MRARVEAASPASFQPLNAQTSAGARSPSGRWSHISGCIRLTVHHGRDAARDVRRSGFDQRAASRASRRRRLRLHAQGPADRRGAGAPYLALELRDRTGAIPARAFRDADLLAGRFERGELVRVPAASSASATSWQLEVLDDRARGPGRARRDPARSCRSPTATSTSSTASSSTSRARSPTRAYRALLDDAARRRELRAELRRAPCTRGGHHAYLGGLLEHTVAVATLALRALPAAPAAQLRPAADRRDRPRHRQDRASSPTAPRSGSPRRAGCSATSRSASGCCRRAPARSTSERRLALLHCVLCHHGPRRAPGGRFASAEALALYRINALDASVKGALEQGL